MIIHGLQKMTLLDFPGKVACTVFLGGCEFRCPFCHNSDLLERNAPGIMDEAELLAFLEKRKGLLDGVAFTGGEPLLRKDLPDVLRKVRALGYPVKLDTNGNHPTQLRAVVEEGLVQYVAMDIKNSPERYAETVGLASVDLENIKESAAFLMRGACDYEFRTTTVDELHDEESFEAIGKWLCGAKRYFIQPFTDRDSVVFSGLHAPDEAKLHRYAEIVRAYIPDTHIRGAEENEG